MVFSLTSNFGISIVLCTQALKDQKVALKQTTKVVTENVFAQAKAQAKKVEPEKPVRTENTNRPFIVYEDTKENGPIAAKKDHVLEEKR